MSRLLLAATILAPLSLRAADWPAFRGPHGNGHADSEKLPLRWSESENVAWKTPIPGDGHSSPVIAGDRIWLTTAIATELTEAEKEARLAKLETSPRGLDVAGSLSLRAICVDRNDGAVLHDVEVFRVDDPEPVHTLNSYASPTPILDGDHVYVHFGSYGTACLDGETGKPVWTQTTLKVDHQNGPGASPVLFENRLIIQYDGIDQQFVVGLDKSTGEVAWRTKRSGKLPDRAEFQKAYCTPTVVETDDGPVLVSPGSDWVYGYDPATGEEKWRAAYGQLGFSTVPKPVIGHGLAFISTSFMQPRVLAVKYDGTGDVSESHVVWTNDRNGPKKPSMLLVGETLVVVNDNGVAAGLDAKSGEVAWQERIGGSHSASPLYAGGRVYAFDQEGKTVVFSVEKGFEKLAENQLDAGCMASPAVADDALFMRTKTHLYRIESGK